MSDHFPVIFRANAVKMRKFGRLWESPGQGFIRSIRAYEHNDVPLPIPGEQVENTCILNYPLSIDGVSVTLPFKPYPAQVGVVRNVIHGLKYHRNVMVESPTGTGKSVALLCAALGWLKHYAVNEEQSSKPLAAEGQLTNERRRQQNVPIIIFATRTHKQIDQIVRELRKTVYSDVNMTILGSRDQYCVHQKVTALSNKSDKCLELCSDKNGQTNCTYAENFFLGEKFTFSEFFKSTGLRGAWTAGEFVDIAKRTKRVCPYFAARSFVTENVQLILCPYKYLFDKSMRKACLADRISGSVIIFDEGHNLESISMETASSIFEERTLQNAIKTCDEIKSTFPDIAVDLSQLKLMLHSVVNWMTKRAKRLQIRPDSAQNFGSWRYELEIDGLEFLRELDSERFDKASCVMYQVSLEQVMKQRTISHRVREADRVVESCNKHSFKVVPTALLELFDTMLKVLSYMNRHERRSAHDFRAVLLKEHSSKLVQRGECSGNENLRVTDFQTSNRQRVPNSSTDSFKYPDVTDQFPATTTVLKIYCLNPGIVMEDFVDARSVILASGTLSPMQTIASETQVSFPIRFQGSHVIDKGQVWVGGLGLGPSGYPLKAIYEESCKSKFQDEFGRIILQVSELVPYGILVFLPSYSTMHYVLNRWKQTGMYGQLLAMKIIFEENSGEHPADFASDMNNFYETVKKCEREGRGIGATGITGAIFFAVYRGKVSEGIDFSDNYARAVITLGIPFPPPQDLKVKFKKRFNDEWTAERGIIPGKDWYHVQAFRSLNQALGRCIRHRNDYGALLLIDARFHDKERYVHYLPSWIEAEFVMHMSSAIAMNSLEKFVAIQRTRCAT